MRFSGITVCVPTHPGREELTGELLASLSRARAATRAPVEVIVVGHPEQGAILERLCGSEDAIFLRGPRSAGAKRNLAAERATYDLLLFVDSDCLATESLLLHHLDALESADRDIAGAAGRTVMHGPMTRVWRTLESSRLHNACFDFTEMYSEVGWAVTCNLSVRRDVLLQVGGFAGDTYTRFGGEDVDFGVRVRSAGLRWITAPDATVLHQRAPIDSLYQAARKLFTYGRADVFLTMRHRDRRVPHTNPVALGIGAFALGARSREPRRSWLRPLSHRPRSR